MKMLKKIFYYTIILSLFSFSAYSINLKFTKIVNLDYPWSLTFINDNELLISEKNGKIKLINLSTKKIKEIEHNLIYSSYGQMILFGFLIPKIEIPQKLAHLLLKQLIIQKK